nr:ABC transporter substrate-binding protein [Hyphomicrobiales bacterium]
TLPATQADALGMFSASQWTPGMDNEANKRFVADFEAEYDYVPSLYASQGYDLAMLIDSAAKKVSGDLSDKAAFRQALEAAEFTSVRGDFKFNTNHFPIQDFYLVEAVEREDGKYQTQVVEKVFEDYGDVYAAECKMN